MYIYIKPNKKTQQKNIKIRQSGGGSGINGATPSSYWILVLYSYIGPSEMALLQKVSAMFCTLQLT